MASGRGDDEGLPPIRLMNFVSEEQLEAARKSRGSRVDDGTAQRDRSLYEILKENKDKKDAEFNERFRHKPPKALDEDESEFLDKVDMSRREYEQKMADEEAQELREFQAAVAAQEVTLQEPKRTHPSLENQDQKLFRRKNPPPNPLAMVIKVVPPAKKAKPNASNLGETSMDAGIQEGTTYRATGNEISVHSSAKTDSDNNASLFAKSGCLVSYSDESEEDN